MPAELMQDRDKAFGDVSENLTLINHEVLFEKTGLVLNLAKPEVQQAITRWCVEGGFKVLVIDNLSTLASGVKENDADAWEMLLPWLLDLRRKKIAVLLVHHAGRSGAAHPGERTAFSGSSSSNVIRTTWTKDAASWSGSRKIAIHRSIPTVTSGPSSLLPMV
jgi:hypothetical protein